MGSAERQEIRRAVWGMAAGAGFLGCLSSLYLFSWANLSQSLSRPRLSVECRSLQPS